MKPSTHSDIHVKHCFLFKVTNGHELQSLLSLTSVGGLPVEGLQDQSCTDFINSKSSYESFRSKQLCKDQKTDLTSSKMHALRKNNCPYSGNEDDKEM